MLRRWVLLGLVTLVLSLWGLQLCQLVAKAGQTAGWRKAVTTSSGWLSQGVAESKDAAWLWDPLPTGSSWYRSRGTHSPWLPLIEVWFPENLTGSAREVVTGVWPDRNDPVEQTAGWWLCVWVVGLGMLGLVACDARARERIARRTSPRWSSMVKMIAAAAAFWIVIVPTLFAGREFLDNVWRSVAEDHSMVVGYTWIQPRLCTASGTLIGLMLALVSIVWLARMVVASRRHQPDAEPNADQTLCRTCAYAVGDLARCPECGDAEPRGPGPYFITRLGSWIHAKAWRRWGLRTFVVAWIAVTLLLPAIVGYAQMIGSRAGWW